MEALIRMMDWFYRLVVQFGFSAWATVNDHYIATYQISSSTPFSDMLGYSSPLYVNMTFHSIMVVVYEIFCGLPNLLLGAVINFINTVLNWIGIGTIPVLNFSAYPMILGVAFSMPFWLSLWLIFKLLKKFWQAVPIL